MINFKLPEPQFHTDAHHKIVSLEFCCTLLLFNYLNTRLIVAVLFYYFPAVIYANNHNTTFQKLFVWRYRLRLKVVSFYTLRTNLGTLQTQPKPTVNLSVFTLNWLIFDWFVSGFLWMLQAYCTSILQRQVQSLHLQRTISCTLLKITAWVLVSYFCKTAGQLVFHGRRLWKQHTQIVNAFTNLNSDMEATGLDNEGPSRTLM